MMTGPLQTMWRSFTYKDNEWELKNTENYPMLEIKTKNSSRAGSSIHTKQVRRNVFKFTTDIRHRIIFSALLRLAALNLAFLNYD